MFINSNKLRETINDMQNAKQEICFADVYMAIENNENCLNSSLPNIYTILDNMKFEELCKNSNLDINKVFPIIQNFYEELSDME